MTSVFRIRIRNFVIPGNITGVTNALETVTTLFRDVCNAVSLLQLLCAMPLNNFTMRFGSITFQAQLQNWRNFRRQRFHVYFFGVPGNITGCNTRYRNCYQLSCDVCNAVSSLELLMRNAAELFTMRFGSITFQAQLRTCKPRV